MAGPTEVANLGASATQVLVNPKSSAPNVKNIGGPSTLAYFKGAYFEAGGGGEGTLKIQTQVNGTWTTKTEYALAANADDSVYVPGTLGIRLKDGLRVLTNANIANAQIFYT